MGINNETEESGESPWAMAGRGRPFSAHGSHFLMGNLQGSHASRGLDKSGWSNKHASDLSTVGYIQSRGFSMSMSASLHPPPREEREANENS